MNLKAIVSVAMMSLTWLAVGAFAQVAGTTTSSVDMTQVASGWSVKKKFLDKTVYNEANKRIGKIQDIIIAPDGKASYIIIGAGGFVGLGRHDVVIPAGHLAERDQKFVLPGATKESIKALPKFVYAKT